MSKPVRPSRLFLAAAACLLVGMQTGCTSALSTAYLRDGLWGGSEHAAQDTAEPDAGAEQQDDAPEAAAKDTDPAADRERREAALEEAMARLSQLGTLDPAIEAALVATLQRTQPEDWPVVVDEFTASLPSSPPATAAPPPGADELPAAPPTNADDTDTVRATDPGESAPAVADSTAAAPPAPETDAPPPASWPTPNDTDTPVPALAVRTACFASAVRAWGEVDRFEVDRFRPGQEIIVYVELDNLASGDSPAGHTTRIDTSLQLVDAADRTLHIWTFDPIAETCSGHRRDYFARYVVRIPESTPPGGCRVEMAVTDTLAGATVTTTLPLEIASAE